ncbi:hypothetical protein CYMTET_40578 [Cymbomonas tetramitiformis]|uniref:Uncharacterized protein n=1 Tax=Cymbomonas tetramitiformis TaxID=36881 RepID=A0AAE0F2U0_9CHLO|nr:hypothetical protein CYMTET_40578 [Cymbomonas tetramitiformis]
MSTDRVSLGSRLRAARGPGVHSPNPSPPVSPASSGNGDPIVRMSQLGHRPLPISRAATSGDFHADASVWVSTPVRPSQRSEHVDKLDYAFTYGDELAKLLRAHGFKSSVGLTLDGPEAESDFAVLLTNMAHVFGPISRDDFVKLLDLENEYTDYHVTLNELIFAVLPTVFRSTALLLYEESAYVHPRDGRCASQRLRFHVEGIGDPDTHRFWVRLRAVIIDETIEPAPQLALYLPYLRGQAPPAPSWATVALARAGGPPLRPSMHYFGPRQKLVPPVGEWKAVQNARYLQWEGTGIVCVTCFRPWAVTTGHLDTDGVCPFSCSASFAPGRAPAAAPTVVAPPLISAWPPVAPPAAHAHAIRALEPPPHEDCSLADSARMDLRFAHDGDLPAINSGPTLETAAMSPAFYTIDQEDEQWPAYCSGLVWIPSSAGNRGGAASSSSAGPHDVPAEAP